MREFLQLLQNIQNLPSLSVTEKELNALAEIIIPLEKKSGDEFLIALKDKNIPLSLLDIKTSLINSTADYLDARNEMAYLLRSWYKIVASLWCQINHSEISADDLLPLTITLLPDDINQLKKIQAQIYFASKFDYSGEAAYLLVILDSAIMAKLDVTNQNDKTSKTSKPDSHHLKVNAVIDEIDRQEKIHILRVMFDEYQSKLEELILQKIKEKDPIIYRTYYVAINKRGGQRAVMSEIVNDTHKDNSLLSDYKELVPLTDKYIAATVLLRSLNQEKIESQLILKNFEDLYSIYQSKLLENDETMLGVKILKTISNVLFIDKVTALFGWPPKDTKFPGVSGLFSGTMKPQEPVQKQVPVKLTPESQRVVGKP